MPTTTTSSRARPRAAGRGVNRRTGCGTIALDVMGGDGGPAVVIAGARRFLAQSRPGKRDRAAPVRLLLVGDPDAIAEQVGTDPLPADRVEIVPAEEVVTMEDTAAVALRTKKRSSMRLAVDAVKDGRADACVSSGNTGALMAVSKFVLKTLPGIDRPAIAATIPAIDGHTHMLDLGANVDCDADHLYQFALMGSILAQAVDGPQRPAGWTPRVGLLNIGSEDIKGNEQVKRAAPLLAGAPINYIGFVEANDIYTDRVDVVVCDGFVGNVSLKTSEGVARMVSHYLKYEFRRTLPNRFVGLLAMPILKAFGARIDPRHYNGATLLGLNGIVIKSHGGADDYALANALRIAALEIEDDVPATIRAQLDTAMDAA